jgi:hypothetical protein
LRILEEPDDRPVGNLIGSQHPHSAEPFDLLERGANIVNANIEGHVTGITRRQRTEPAVDTGFRRLLAR